MYRCLLISTDTYQTSLDDFMVDVVENVDSFDAFLYRLGYGIKTFMFGVDKADTTKKEFLAMVKENLATYAEYYTEEYCD